MFFKLLVLGVNLSKRVSLFHRVSYQQWHDLVYAQIICRAIRRTTGRHWYNSNAKYKPFYKFYQRQLIALNRIDRQELNSFIEWNNKDIDGRVIRELMANRILYSAEDIAA